MGKLTPEQLKAIRIECAVGICTRFPVIYSKIMEHRETYVNEKEKLAGHILKGLLKLEPCVGHILDFYYKRELR